MKRLISATSSEIKAMNKEELKQAIKASEGRIVCSENVALHAPLEQNITYSEFAKSFGADLILLNGFDTFNPIVLGMNGQNQMSDPPLNEPDSIIQTLKDYVGLPIGVNLEPIDLSADMMENQLQITKGRQATIETFKKANKLGFDFICLTGNPGVGVSNRTIEESIIRAKDYYEGIIIAGKMHSAGVNEPVITLEDAAGFIDAGCDVLLIPGIGTVLGLDEKVLKPIVEYAHDKNTLVMSAIGTSQESSTPETIREIALKNKILGVDIQHIGDANMGIYGISNIEVLSDTIRGKRHTSARKARSVIR